MDPFGKKDKTNSLMVLRHMLKILRSEYSDITQPLMREIFCNPATVWTKNGEYQGKFNVLLKKVEIWFSQGCNGEVLIKLTKNGTDFIPIKDEFCSEGYAGNGNLITIPLNLELTGNDKIEVYYKNSDAHNIHPVFVTLYIKYLRRIVTEGTTGVI